jgi:hypothetical protein
VIGVRVIRVSFESPEMNFQSFFNTHESSTNEQLGYFGNININIYWYWNQRLTNYIIYNHLIYININNLLTIITPYINHILTIYINHIFEGSLEVKLPTIWTDEKQSREEAERRERLEERRVEEKE